MKHAFNKVTSLVAALAVALVLPACTGPANPDGTSTLSGFSEKIVPLATVGLGAAAARGAIHPGDVLTIAKAAAIIRAPGSLETKAVPLAELGLEEAIARGSVKPGDELWIREGIAVLKEPTPPPVQAEPVPLTASK